MHIFTFHYAVKATEIFYHEIYVTQTEEKMTVFVKYSTLSKWGACTVNCLLTDLKIA